MGACECATNSWPRAGHIDATEYRGGKVTIIRMLILSVKSLHTVVLCRYLKVPISTAGGSSSADSVISSSSGHFMSETGGTPGTISSASSMDELHVDAGNRQAMRKCHDQVPLEAFI